MSSDRAAALVVGVGVGEHKDRRRARSGPGVEWAVDAVEGLRKTWLGLCRTSGMVLKGRERELSTLYPHPPAT